MDLGVVPEAIGPFRGLVVLLEIGVHARGVIYPSCRPLVGIVRRSGALGGVKLFASQSESGVHHLEGLNAGLFGHHTAGSDFAGSDETDVDAGVRQRAEHAPRRSWSCRHSSAHSTHPGNGLTILQSGTGPLGQQGGQGYIGAGMPATPGTAGRMFRALADAGINIGLIATSEIRTSCVVAEDDGVQALQVVHAGFGLGGEERHTAQGTASPHEPN